VDLRQVIEEIWRRKTVPQLQREIGPLAGTLRDQLIVVYDHFNLRVNVRGTEYGFMIPGHALDEMRGPMDKTRVDDMFRFLEARMARLHEGIVTDIRRVAKEHEPKRDHGLRLFGGPLDVLAL
jgi:hypothetical protein